MIPRKVLLCVLVGGLLAASTAGAGPTSDMTIQLLGRDPGSGPGGVYVFEVVTSTVPGFSAGDRFESFCLERAEWVHITDPPQTYDAVVNTKAVGGGMGMVGDPIDPKTAYLYSRYRNGTLGGWTDDDASADALQYVIWELEGEPTVGVMLSDAAEAKVPGFRAVAESSPWTDIGDVRVLNLSLSLPAYYGSNGFSTGLTGMYGACGPLSCGGWAQDQLILLPHIPAPPAVLLGLIGLGLVARTNVRRFLR